MKHARDMDETERKAALAELKRGLKPAPPPPTEGKPKLAKDMTPAEQAAFLAEHKKKFA